MADILLVSDCIYREVSSKLQGKFWPTSQWRQAIKGINRDEKALKEAPKVTDEKINFPGTVLFVPSNETHVKMFYPITKSIRDRQFLIWNKRKNAGKYLNMLREEFIEFILPDESKKTLMLKPIKSVIKRAVFPKSKSRLKKLYGRLANLRTISPTRILRNLSWKPSVVVFGNDWGFIRPLIAEAKIVKIPTVCIQEGPQDFDLPSRPMMHADYVFLQGPIHMSYLNRNEFIITGNPRLENLKVTSLPTKPLVMVNANFACGIHEDARNIWINGVVRACKNAKIDFFISKHPRDFGKYKGFNVINSDAFKIEEQINISSLLITRFSQVLYEAMLHGRPVIYYNPHGEVKKVLTEDRTRAILYAKNPEELVECLKEALAFKDELRNRIHSFLNLHCGEQDGKATERCLHGLSVISNRVI